MEVKISRNASIGNKTFYVDATQKFAFRHSLLFSVTCSKCSVCLNLTRPCFSVQFIAAMTRPSASWNDIPRRLKRHFATVYCSSPDAQQLDLIFTTTASSYFSEEHDFTTDIQQVVVKLVPLTRRIWYSTKVSVC